LTSAAYETTVLYTAIPNRTNSKSVAAEIIRGDALDFCRIAKQYGFVEKTHQEPSEPTDHPLSKSLDGQRPVARRVSPIVIHRSISMEMTNKTPFTKAN
jgi:hypothetical protein